MDKHCLFCKKEIKDNTLNKNKLYCNEVCSNSYRQLQKKQICLNCKKEFYHHNKNKFCKICGQHAIKPSVKKNCIYCGLEFIDTTRAHKALFDSDACSNAYRQNKKEQICLNCKTKFYSPNKRSFCDSCKYKARRRYNTKKKCIVCKKDIVDKSFTQNHNFCSKDCNYQYNKKDVIKRATEWKKRNPEKNNNINKIYKNKMYETNPYFKLQGNIRGHLRTILKNYTLTGKISSSKKYGISYINIINKLENDAGFKFDNNKQTWDYLKEKEIEHSTPIHQLFEIGKKYIGDEKEVFDKIKILYSPRNLTLMLKSEHKNKSAKEYSEHSNIKYHLEKKTPIIIREVSKEDTMEIVNKFHYSDVMPRFSKSYLGGFLGDSLIGIMTLGWGVQPERTIKKLFPSLSKNDYYEIGKLCLDERMPRNSESRFMSACLKYIKEHYKQIKLIYTWADGILGKPGFVYQASNFLYGGHIWCKRYFTNDGYKIHPRSSRWLCEDNSKTIGKRLYWLTQDYMNEKGIKLYKGQQFRYVYFLCKDKEKKELVKQSTVVWNLNYPKVGDLIWQIKINDNEKYQISDKPLYIGSLNAEETKKLI